jgi:hypothetical protein
LQTLYPWAGFQVDEELYDDEDGNNFMENYGIWDPED